MFKIYSTNNMYGERKRALASIKSDELCRLIKLNHIEYTTLDGRTVRSLSVPSAMGYWADLREIEIMWGRSCSDHKARAAVFSRFRSYTPELSRTGVVDYQADHEFDGRWLNRLSSDAYSIMYAITHHNPKTCFLVLEEIDETEVFG